MCASGVDWTWTPLTHQRATMILRKLAITQVPSERLARAGHVLRTVLLMRAPHMISDRKLHLRTYRRCMVGSDMVDWITQQSFPVHSRTQAVGMWQALLEEFVIVHGKFSSSTSFRQDTNCATVCTFQVGGVVTMSVCGGGGLKLSSKGTTQRSHTIGSCNGKVGRRRVFFWGGEGGPCHVTFRVDLDSH